MILCEVDEKILQKDNYKSNNNNNYCLQLNDKKVFNTRIDINIIIILKIIRRDFLYPLKVIVLSITKKGPTKSGYTISEHCLFIKFINKLIWRMITQQKRKTIHHHQLYR